VEAGRVVLGERIGREGDNGREALDVVLEGEIDIYEGDQKVGERVEGGIFGERNISESDRFDYTALARSECTLLLMQKGELLNLMSKHIEILESWIDIMNGKVTEEEEIVDVLFS